MLELLKDLPKAVLYMTLGAALGMYGAGYYTAFQARKAGFEAEFSDYGRLKKISRPESLAVKNCRELRIAYDVGQQALVEQMRTFANRRLSDNQSLVDVLRLYPAARQRDEEKNQTASSYSSSSTILSNSEEIRRDITAVENAEQGARKDLEVEYNNLSRFCIQSFENQQ